MADKLLNPGYSGGPGRQVARSRPIWALLGAQSQAVWVSDPVLKYKYKKTLRM